MELFLNGKFIFSLQSKSRRPVCTVFVFFTCDSHFRSHQEFSYIHTSDPHCLTLLSRRSGIDSRPLSHNMSIMLTRRIAMLTYGLLDCCTDYISVGRMLYSICVRSTLTLKFFLTLSRNDERMRLLCTH